ncbi:MAG: GNAT family N-acetyltransferase [Allomuricauda sp.]
MDEIKIREATKSDSAEIVELLKIALGESTEKSVDNWLWKHYDNPFGESKIYLATIGSEIVGVRAFMQWRWLEKSTGKELRAVRAVDTAVSPHHRRKGIFLTLTNHALEKVTEEGFDFVFNTPNEQSIGGYLKLGWVLNRKIPVGLLINPFFWLSSKKQLEQFSKEAQSDIEKNDYHFNSPFMKSDIICPFSKTYFDWRYVKNPLATYKFFKLNEEILIVYRLKTLKGIPECRIVDIQLLKPGSQDKIGKAIAKLAKRYALVSMTQGLVTSKFLIAPVFIALNIVRKGPNMVTKNLNLSATKYEHLLDKNTSYWGYNLGDMELF